MYNCCNVQRAHTNNVCYVVYAVHQHLSLVVQIQNKNICFVVHAELNRAFCRKPNIYMC